MKNKWKIALLAITLSISASQATFHPTYSIYASTPDSSMDIMPMSDKIIWKYKMIGATAYKRLYNATKHKWVGNWIKA